MGDQKYMRADVSGRNGKNGAPLWIIVKDVVYDVTSYLREHPGGIDALEEQAGKDATKDFEAVGHSGDAREILKKYRVGQIVEKKKKEADKGPVKPTNKLLPPEKPATAGPPPSKPKDVPTGLQSGRTSSSNPPEIPTRDSLEAPTDAPIVIATEVTIASNTTSLSSTNLVSEGTPVASIKLASGTSIGLVTVSSAQSGETISTNNVHNQSAVLQNVQEDDSPNSKHTDSDSKAVDVSSTISSTNIAQSSSSTTSATSSKSSPTVLQGLSKMSLSPSKPATKQAQLPWSSFSQPAKQKTPSTFSGSANNASSKTKMGHHDPFKNNKMAGVMKRK